MRYEDGKGEMSIGGMYGVIIDLVLEFVVVFKLLGRDSFGEVEIVCLLKALKGNALLTTF